MTGRYERVYYPICLEHMPVETVLAVVINAIDADNLMLCAQARC